MNQPILVTGGTGNIGSRVVPLLCEAGQSVRILTRHPHSDSPGIQHVVGDTTQDTGLADAFDGVGTILHLAGGAKGDDIAARNVVSAARKSQATHLVLISVVGADRMPIGYFRAKAAAEAAFADSGLPWTVIRVAQLHDLVLPVVRILRRMPFLLAPTGMQFEPVDVAEVARRLAELTLGVPSGRVADLAGPEVLDLPTLAVAYAETYGRRGRARLPLRLPGAVGRAYRSGENLAGLDADRGTCTWREYLERSARSGVTGSAPTRPDACVG